MSNILIVYYSRKGQNYFGGAIKQLDKGNTEIVAEYIQQAVGGDLFEVDTVVPYPADYKECCAEAYKQLKQNARPQLKQYLDSIDGYDTIFVGYPNWCGTMPMPMFTFLEKYDMQGKTIVSFCTNEGSGMGVSQKDIARVCVGAKVLDGLSMRGTACLDSSATVAEWAKNILKVQR